MPVLIEGTTLYVTKIAPDQKSGCRSCREDGGSQASWSGLSGQ